MGLTGYDNIPYSDQGWLPTEILPTSLEGLGFGNRIGLLFDPLIEFPEISDEPDGLI